MFDRAPLAVLAHKKLVGLFDISSLLPYYLGPFNSYTKKKEQYCTYSVTWLYAIMRHYSTKQLNFDH
jgi:hypothetical protein